MTGAPITPDARQSRNRRDALLVAALVFGLDQLAKWIVTVPLSLEKLGSITPFPSLPMFSLTWAENRGISFSLLNADTEWGRWGLVLLTGAVALGVLVWLWRERARGDVLALALILGGALGNIVDRIRLGYVVDYADLHFGDFRPFMIFNVADAAITFGVLILVARAVLLGDKAGDHSVADADRTETGTTAASPARHDNGGSGS